MNIQSILIALAAGFFLGFLLTYNYMSKSIQVEQASNIALSDKNAMLSLSVKRQNQAVLDMQKHAKDQADKYVILKNKPSVIKYIHVKSNDCEDIKIILDDIRSTNF